ncbi:MAG: glycosyltransferase family 4 protein [Candidatus Moranbacteria bacterium]|nr:glycosyltransferase family 4 protein [Candidatus Moranbacteria bacterium]
MKILFISHTFPPIVGGVETQNYELSVHLKNHAEKFTLIANRRRYLIPLFLPYATLKALFLAKNYDVVLLGSCLLGIVGWTIKKLTKKPVVSVAHGLDLTYKNAWYQKFWVKKFIPTLDKLIAVGNETIRQGVARGIPQEKFVFIPNGVDTEKFFAPHEKKELEPLLGCSVENKKILLTSGRLARRKGVAWLIRHVIPKLSHDILYIVAGDGADRENIGRAVEEARVSDRVKLLGYVSDETRNILFNTADLFVQPNIKIEGDMEGFGISVIEAASCELPVVASALEGLKDAIKDNENGRLVETGNADHYVKVITDLLSDMTQIKIFGQKARRYVVSHYAWETIAKEYVLELEKIAKKGHN